MRIRPRFRRYFLPVSLLFLGMGIGALVLALVSAGEIYDYRDTVDGVHLPPVDAIVVLAGGRGRIAAAGDVWYRYWELSHIPISGAGKSPVPTQTPILYLSGMGQRSNFNTLSHQVRRGVLGVLKPENVVIEAVSGNTEENALWLANIAKEHAWEKIILITSPYHMRRARLIFNSVLSSQNHPMQIETLSAFQEPFEPGEWITGLNGIRVTLLEYLKLLYYQTVWKPDPNAEALPR